MSLKEARRKKGLSQLELAESVGVSRATIINYESGKQMPKIAILKKICDTLGIQMKEVVEEI